jgi:hypothetical protein
MGKYVSQYGEALTTISIHPFNEYSHVQTLLEVSKNVIRHAVTGHPPFKTFSCGGLTCTVSLTYTWMLG